MAQAQGMGSHWAHRADALGRDRLRTRGVREPPFEVVGPTAARHAAACCSRRPAGCREHVPEVCSEVPRPAGLAVEAEHRPHDRQAQQLPVTESRWLARQPCDTCQVIVGLHTECGPRGVQVSRHK